MSQMKRRTSRVRVRYTLFIGIVLCSKTNPNPNPSFMIFVSKFKTPKKSCIKHKNRRVRVRDELS